MSPISLVSVCLPTFNGEKFLPEALNSLFSQDYSHIELVVSDDDSKDSTLEIVKQFQCKADFPVRIFNHKPSGIGANWNNCIRKAEGKYIKFLFQDDILYPGCIRNMVEVINYNREFGLVACKRDFLLDRDESTEIKDWILKYGNLQAGIKISIKGNYSIIDKSLFKSPALMKSPLNKIGEPTAVLFEKDIINKVGMFKENMNQILDFEFFYRILKYKKIVVINESLVGFRLHHQQATIVNFQNLVKEDAQYERILFNDFFWYLSTKERVRLLKKYCLPW